MRKFKVCLRCGKKFLTDYTHGWQLYCGSKKDKTSCSRLITIELGAERARRWRERHPENKEQRKQYYKRNREKIIKRVISRYNERKINKI